MIERPLFSIAIPTYNRLELLKKAVDSALKQTYENIEVIIMNNASTDGTQDWLNSLAGQNPKVKVVHNPDNIGAIKNVKLVPQYVNGKYLVILPDDDLLETTFAEEAVKDLNTNDQATIWYCRANFIYCDLGKKTVTRVAPLIEDGLVYVKQSLRCKRETQYCVTVYKMSTLREIGGFIAETLSIDYSTRCLCAAKGKVLFNPKILGNYFSYKGNTTTMSPYREWIDANCELYDLIERYIGQKYKYYCAYRSAYVFKYILGYYGINGALSCFIAFWRRYPFWFPFILFKKLPFICITLLLPKAVIIRIKNLLQYFVRSPG